jgi:hypothetical protein
VVVLPLPPARRAVGRSGGAAYSTQRPRQLADDEQEAIRSLALTRSLRSLAAEFGVSHETMRRVIQDADVVVA